jgi:Na+-transporting methylmalonyl-CoA/oxaloacetate decarboxylase gamma subunit
MFILRFLIWILVQYRSASEVTVRKYKEKVEETKRRSHANRSERQQVSKVPVLVPIIYNPVSETDRWHRAHRRNWDVRLPSFFLVRIKTNSNKPRRNAIGDVTVLQASRYHGRSKSTNRVNAGSSHGTVQLNTAPVVELRVYNPLITGWMFVLLLLTILTIRVLTMCHFPIHCFRIHFESLASQSQS